jgi:hypothetical protein
MRGVVGAALAGAGAYGLVALLAALKMLREVPGVGFDLPAALARIVAPGSITDWVQLAGILVFAAIGGLFTAAIAAGRRRV